MNERDDNYDCKQQQDEHQQWLDDPVAQAEYRAWLDSLSKSIDFEQESLKENKHG